ncbi:phage Gp37/Gp68 family protein [Cereibacter sphaeroides f. sp. denitrificans]|nr:phage Gp37/Gp68 family protein [Cereibacter sphaeroides f. sp. denitrificans]
MAETSKIEWTDATWNPITGCTLASPGCQFCYAADLAATRLSQHPSRAGLARRNAAGVAAWTGEVRLNEQWLDQPLRWKRPRRIFVCAHADLFHENVPDEWIDRVFAVMALAPQHTFQVLTKRAARMREYVAQVQAQVYWRDLAVAARKGRVGLVADMALLRDHGLGPLPNVWLGVSAEDQQRADERIPDLLATPAAVRFASLEPLLGPVDLTNIKAKAGAGIDVFSALEYDGDPDEDVEFGTSVLDWIIVGGESGRHARPMHPDWARSLRDQAQAAGVPFLFKQWGEWGHAAPAPSGTPGKYAIASAPLGSDMFPTRVVPVDHYPRQFSLFGGASVMERVGKRAAGRRLDGRIWDEMPEVAHAHLS